MLNVSKFLYDFCLIIKVKSGQGYNPIAPGTRADPLVQSWGSFEADPVNLSTIAKLRSEALRLTELADFDG